MENKPEYTDKLNVVCKGEAMVTGHPITYYQIKPEIGNIECRYCGKKFILKTGRK